MYIVYNMKNLSPRDLVFIVTGTLSFMLLVVLYALTRLAGTALPTWVILGIPTVNFIIGYFLLGALLEKFIYRRVKVIYKTINNLKASKGTGALVGNMTEDMLSNVEREVVDWTKRQSQELETLRSSDNYRKEFIGNVSHELKTPIFNIQGYIHTLIDGGLYDEKINKSYLYKASQNLDRLSAIVEDLETISQLETNALLLDIRKFDLIKLLKEVMESLEMQADLKDINFFFKDDSPKSLNVMADKERVRQVITNLFTNSIKYGKPSGSTTVGLYDMDENFLVEITDNGIGIAEVHLPRLFERFYRVDKSRARDQGGTGLGLAIVKHIVEAHHQTINVRSTVGMGSTFGFTIKKA
ncbi:ATP-binding protein [soil metagenome]